MLTFYYSKGSSALAAHILLEELGVPYSAKEIAIAAGAHRTDAFLAINPKGRIPALTDDDLVITENPAILTHLGETHPDAGLLPQSASGRAKLNEVLAYLCGTVHVAYAHFRRGARWSNDPAVIAALADQAPHVLTDAAALIESQYLQGPWVLGAQFTIADPYMFLVPRWIEMVGLTFDPFPRLSAHKAAMLQRPATRAAMKAHGL